ncbi:MAG: rhomboid family intramembrane serine protease, partial [Actinomycetota bacterium]
MFPLKDANPTLRVPVVTIGLIAANIVAFLFEPLAGSDLEQARFFVCNAAIPAEVMNGEQLERLGHLFNCPGKNVWLSVLVSMFLHGGLLHIAGNMLFLWVFGNNVEDRLGRGRFVFFYLACGAAATLAQSALSRDSIVPLVGASGAIAGVLGAYLFMFPHARVTTLFFYVVTDVPAVVVLAGWFLLQVFQGVGSVRGAASGGVAYFAHIGGFIAGIALLGLLRPRSAR